MPARSALRWIWILLLFSARLTGVRAQPIGNPIVSQSQGQFFVGLNASLARQTIGGVDHESRRLVLRAGQELFGRLDLYAEVGLGDLTLKLENTAHPDLRADPEVMLGGGATFRLLSLRSLGVMGVCGGRLLWYRSSPSHSSKQVIANRELAQVLELNYECREALFHLGMIKNARIVNVYGGLAAEWISRLETRSNKRLIDDQMVSQSSENGEYLSGLKLEGYIGFDFRFKKQVRLNIELQGTRPSDFVLNVGLSQSGKP